MGCTNSTSMEDKDALEKTKQIDSQLAKERDGLRNQVKVLLLGTGESGKSTVMKQMRIIYSTGFEAQERHEYVDIIYANTVQSLHAVLEALPLLGLHLDPSNEDLANIVEELDPDVRDTTSATRDALITLCRDPCIKDAIEQAHRFQLNNSAEYFFDAVARVTDPNYSPTDNDLIRARIRTTGISETRLQIGKLKYRIFDVGGQRSERKKWLNVFENVNSLLFLCAVSEYNEQLYEDESVGRLQESIVVFSGISNSRWFNRSTIVLLLNKTDLFIAKYARYPIKDYFPAYSGSTTDYREGLNFFLGEFKAIYHQPKPLYHHFTHATDTQSLKVVTDAINDTLVRQMLESLPSLL